MLVNEIFLREETGGSFEFDGVSYDLNDLHDVTKEIGGLFRKGKKGQIKGPVKILQAYLNKENYNAGPVDGWYGKKTAVAVRKFQEKHDLTPDGDAGPATVGKMIDLLIKPVTIASVTTSDDTKNNIWTMKNFDISTFDKFYNDFADKSNLIMNDLKYLVNKFKRDLQGTEKQLVMNIANEMKNAEQLIGLKISGDDYIAPTVLQHLKRIYDQLPRYDVQLEEIIRRRESPKLSKSM